MCSSMQAVQSAGAVFLTAIVLLSETADESKGTTTHTHTQSQTDENTYTLSISPSSGITVKVPLLFVWVPSLPCGGDGGRR